MQEEVDTSMYDAVAGMSETDLFLDALFHNLYCAPYNFFCQTTGFKRMHMSRMKEKQAHIICMEALKIASCQNLPRRNGRTQ